MAASLFYGIEANFIQTFLVTNCTINLCSVDVSVSVNSNIDASLINIFDKIFNFSFTIAAGCLIRLRNIKN